VRWPGALAVRPDARTATPSHVVDVAATILDLAGVAGDGLDGIPLTDVLQGVERIREEPIVWEHEGWRAIRDGHLKAVARWRGDWELYDLADDPTEQLDLAAHRPNDVARLASQWQAWSDAAGVQPWPWVMPEAGRIARFAGIFTTALVVGLILIVRRVRRR
jgi:arylsulfatase A-like enzyme